MSHEGLFERHGPSMMETIDMMSRSASTPVARSDGRFAISLRISPLRVSNSLRSWLDWTHVGVIVLRSLLGKSSRRQIVVREPSSERRVPSFTLSLTAAGMSAGATGSAPRMTTPSSFEPAHSAPSDLPFFLRVKRVTPSISSSVTSSRRTTGLTVPSGVSSRPSRASAGAFPPGVTNALPSASRKPMTVAPSSLRIVPSASTVQGVPLGFFGAFAFVFGPRMIAVVARFPAVRWRSSTTSSGFDRGRARMSVVLAGTSVSMGSLTRGTSRSPPRRLRSAAATPARRRAR